ncbi:BMC domain-containing protein [Candidatus Merdisoma sp. JLR.KK011]|uniref:BMC domain-containing protein n=1 Tax=Candidatus Merdisoma sp. JLR.KK011 TaxID=3114299 RepID=UPI002FEFC137
MKALGMIEVYGYLAAVEALDSALKAANVSLVNVEKVKGGLVAVLVEGDVGAVKAAMDASAAAAERLGTVVSVHVIPRPAEDVARMLGRQEGTPGPDKDPDPQPPKPPAPEPEPEAEPDPESGTPEEPESVEEPEAVEEPAPISEPEPKELSLPQGMESMSVQDLRKLARELEITNMTRAEIRYAKKQELIQKITEYKQA